MVYLKNMKTSKLVFFAVRLGALAAMWFACSAFMVRSDGVKVVDVPTWKPRMAEIASKFERKVFGAMPDVPAGLSVECILEDKNYLAGKATLKRIKFTWPRLYGKAVFHASVLLPNREGAMSTFVLLRSGAVPERPVPAEDWPFDEIVSRGYATLAFDGAEIAAEDVKDVVSRRALGFRIIHTWLSSQPRIDALNTCIVGCGPVDGTAAFWAGSYDWRIYALVAAQTGLSEEFVELAANNTPGLLYTCSCDAQTPEQIACDKALVEKSSPAWNIYGGLKGFGGNTDWHLRKGPRGLVKEDWMKILSFTDRHCWAISLQQVPLASMPPLPNLPRKDVVRYFAENVYGIAPGRPDSLRFETVSPDKEMLIGDGVKVVRKMMRARWTGARGEGEFPFLAFIPVKTGKIPAIVSLHLGRDRMDPERKNLKESWDVEQITKRGYAAIGVHYGDISPDKAHDFNVRPFVSFETPAERVNTSWGAISAWSWGLSRIMDWVETLPEIDLTKVVVTGHSRGGKTALWTGAQDERFAMTVALGSGRTGMLSNHMAYPTVTESIAMINAGFPHWFCTNYKQWNNRERETPFDQHWLAACIAPRRLLVCEAKGDRTRFGDWHTLVQASPAWLKAGVEAIRPGPFPAMGSAVYTKGTGFFVREGEHRVTSEDWRAILNYADTL